MGLGLVGQGHRERPGERPAGWAWLPVLDPARFGHGGSELVARHGCGRLLLGHLAPPRRGMLPRARTIHANVSKGRAGEEDAGQEPRGVVMPPWAAGRVPPRRCKTACCYWGAASAAAPLLTAGAGSTEGVADARHPSPRRGGLPRLRAAVGRQPGRPTQRLL